MAIVFKMMFLMLQSLTADATMYKQSTFSDTNCTTLKYGEWLTADVCYPHSGSGGSYKWVCNGMAAEARVYSDATCSTVNTAYTDTYATNGVFLTPGSNVCYHPSGSSESHMYTCYGQPTQVTINVFSDATCTTAHSEHQQVKIAVEKCLIDEDSGGVYYSWHLVNNVYSKKTYTDQQCIAETATLATVSNDPAICSQMGDVYVKFVSTISATAAREALDAASAPSPSPSGNTSNTTAAPKATSSKSVQNHGHLLIAMLALLKAVV